MSKVLVNMPPQYIGDTSRDKALFNAKVYVGEIDLDPRIPANQKTVTAIQEDGMEVSIPQPIRTNAGGYYTYNGSVVTLVVDGAYSMAVDDRNDNQKFYYPNASPNGDPIYTEEGVITIDNVAQLRTLTSTNLPDGQVIYLKGHTNQGVGGGELIVRGEQGAAVDDNGVTFIVDGKEIVRNADRVNPEMFGGGIGGDDSTPLESMYRCGIPFSSDASSSYTVTRTISTSGIDVVGDMGGAVITFDENTSNNFRCIHFNVPMTSVVQSVSAISYNVNTIGSSKGLEITVPNASQFSVGDSIKLVSEDPINPLGDADERMGQSFEINKISGSNLYTTKTTDLRFNTSPRVAKFDSSVKIDVSGFRFTMASPGNGFFKVMLDIQGAVEPKINNISSFDSSAINLRVYNCFRASGSGHNGVNLLGNTSNNEIGYVLVDQGSCDSEWSGLSGRRVRHVYTTGAENSSGTDINLYGGACYCTIGYLYGDECHSFAADTHPDSYRTVFQNVVAISSSQERSEQTGAIQFRGWKDHVEALTHTGNDHGLHLLSTARDITFGDLDCIGGRPVTVNGTNSGALPYVVHGRSINGYYDAKQAFGVKVVNASLHVCTYRAVFKNKYTFLSFKLLCQLEGATSNNLYIDNYIIDTSEVVASEYGGHSPVQLASDWGDVIISNCIIKQGLGVGASQGISSFVSGNSGSRLLSKFYVNMKAYVPGRVVDDVILQIRGGNLSASSNISAYAEVHADDGVKRTDSFEFDVFGTNMFLQHTGKTSALDTQPYLNAAYDAYTLLKCRFSGKDIGSLQPPYYEGQIWRMRVRVDSDFGFDMTYAPATTVTLAIGEEIQLIGNSSLEWERIV